MTEHEEQQRERLAHLVTAQLEGMITPPEAQELQGLLSDSPSLQHAYVELMQDISSLRWLSNTSSRLLMTKSVGEGGPTPHHRRRGWKGVAMILAGVAASIGMVTLSIGLVMSGSQANLAERNTPSPGHLRPIAPSPELRPDLVRQTFAPRLPGVATVLRSTGVRWSPHTTPLKEMSRLSPGQTLSFLEGEVEIAFDRTVHMVVRGPARLEIRSALDVYSDYGTFSARVGELGKGFVLETPSGRIVDLGTEFGVAIDRGGKTEVAVFRGAVDLTYGDRLSPLKPSLARTLIQGQAVSLDIDGSMDLLMSIDNERFPPLSPPAPRTTSRSRIFGNISDNRSGLDVTFYQIVPNGLYEDVPAYVDRRHEWNGIDKSGIPAPLVGADYIMPFNDDKYIRNLKLQVEILRPCRLFIFLSEKANEPEWLKQVFTKTDMMIGLDESGEFTRVGYELAIGPGEGIDTRFSVWECHIAEPGTISLGSIQHKHRGLGFCMYGIAAVPLDDES